MTEPHLDSDLIAAYGERRLSLPERAGVEAHLATCLECRRDASAAALLIQGERRRRRRMKAAPLVAVAALLAIVVATGPFPGPVAPGGGLRPGVEAGREGVTMLGAYAPGEDVRVSRSDLRFAWQQDGPDAMYRFTLADRSGLPLWQTTTGDTTLSVPDTLALTPGEGYLWYVDVLLPDVRQATTGVRGFTLGR